VAQATELSERQRQLAEIMRRRGDWPGGAVWLREAVREVPRRAFAPDRLWRWDGRAYVPVDRGSDEDAWAALVYGGPDEAAVTRVSGGVPSSSLSCQAVVVDMLDCLKVEPGHRVLELGTGTGWNAALLAWRAGAGGRVFSIEVDPSSAEEASARLAAATRAGTGTGAGAEVRVVTGDGEAGLTEHAPYDRVIATYAVEQVPWAWVEQTRPGGRIVLPWGRLGHVALTVARDGASATGRMQGLAQFMPAQGVGPAVDFTAVRGTSPADGERSFDRDLRPLHSDWHLRFALRVAMPEVRIDTAVDEDGVNAWLHDGVGSWAALSAVGRGRTVAHEGGPLRLAELLEEAWDRWLAVGSPELYDFGMTVRRGQQCVWAWDSATGPRWPSAHRMHP
jgi:protein-L-isoaspartate(D-aspartate) O-methyltransferase